MSLKPKKLLTFGGMNGKRHKGSSRGEVLRLLKEGYGPAAICRALSFSKSRYYAIIRDLRKLGFLDATFFPLSQKPVPLETSVDQVYTGGVYTGGVHPQEKLVKNWRLHRVQVRFPVLRWVKSWNRLSGRWVVFGPAGRSRYCQLMVDSSRGPVLVRAFEKALDVYMPHFWGERPEDCDKFCLDFILRFIPALEGDVGVVLRKENGVAFFDFVKREYACVGALNAAEHIKRRERIYVQDFNGELRYVVDQSWNQLPEFESVHAVKSRGDARRFNKFYLDVALGTHEKRLKLIQAMSHELLGVTQVAERLTLTTKELVKQNVIIIKSLRDKGILGGDI